MTSTSILDPIPRYSPALPGAAPVPGRHTGDAAQPTSSVFGSSRVESAALANFPLTWLSKNARQDGDVGFRSLTMYLAKVDTATSMPSLPSSLRMRGAPHVTFALDILRVSTPIWWRSARFSSASSRFVRIDDLAAPKMVRIKLRTLGRYPRKALRLD